MASEGQVLNLMRLLENGIREASVIENKLESYDQLLQVCSHLLTCLGDLILIVIATLALKTNLSIS